MILFTHPAVQAYLAAARDDSGHAYGFCDWLMEQGGGLPELCWWFARCEDADLPAMQAALAAWDEVRQPERAERVRLQLVQEYNDGGLAFWLVLSADGSIPHPAGTTPDPCPRCRGPAPPRAGAVPGGGAATHHRAQPAALEP